MDRDARIRLFIMCLLIRTGLATAALTLANGPHMRLVTGVFSGIVSLGFLYQALVARPSNGFFGSPVWWNTMRWLHIVLWGMTAVLFLVSHASSRLAAVPLFIDVIAGGIAGLIHYARL